MAIRNIIFDAGGVLVNVCPSATVEAFERLGLDVSGFVGSARQDGLFRSLELGLLTEQEFYDGVRRLAAEMPHADEVLCRLTDAAIRKAWCSMLGIIPQHRLDAVESLTKTHHVAVLSNTNAIHWEQFNPAHWPLQEHVEHVFLSHELHLEKPTEEIFREVLRQSGYRAEETLLVDDSPANCAMARSLGFHTLTPNYPDEWIAELLPATATIGFFDGVHRGHQFLLQQLREEAERRQQRPLAITFDCHPRQVLHDDYVPQLLTTLPEKCEALSSCEGLQTKILHFDEVLSQLSAQTFMSDILRNRLGVRTLLMGYDHRFGHGGGTLQQYEEWGRAVGIEVLRADVMPGEQVSSSEIRRLLAQGDVRRAAHLLGRPYTLTGCVVHGQKVGRTIGFPTLNLHVASQKMLPARGVYAVRAELAGGGRYGGMLCIGARPTIQEQSEVSVEAHLFDFEGDLYEQQVTLCFVERLRDEEKFPSLEALQQQLQRDAEAARRSL